MTVQLDLDGAMIEWNCGTRRAKFLIQAESSSRVAISCSDGKKMESEEVIHYLLDIILGKTPSGFMPPPSFERL